MTRPGMRVARRLLAATLAFGCLAPATGHAHEATFPSGIQISAATADGGHIIVSGFVTSAKQKCLGGRLVKLFAVQDTGTGNALTLLDTDRTSDEGAWAAMGDDEPPNSELRAVVVRKVMESRGHRHVCGRAEFTTT